MFKPVALGAAALFAVGAALTQVPAQAQQSGTRVGLLTCNVAAGTSFVFGSTRDITCTFAPTSGASETYAGRIERYGVDVGFLQNARIVWAVVAPTTVVAPGSLAGNYGGVSANATVGVGLGANVLVGGSNNTVALQPLSIEGNQGLNIALGVAGLRLERR